MKGGWIAVYVDLNGPKLRRFCKELNICSAFAKGILVTLWSWGQQNTDKDGKLLCVEREDIVDLIRPEVRGSDVDPEKVVNALFNTKWIDVSGEDFFIHDWPEYQAPWIKLNEKLSSDATRKREARLREKGGVPSNEQEMLPDFPGTVPSEQPESGDESSEKGRRKTYPKDFETFWAAYPRQVDKGAAYEKYKARQKDGFSAEELLTAAKRYAADCKKKGTDKEFIKHAKTFLGVNTPFMDFLPKERPEVENGDLPFDPNENPFDRHREEP